MRILIGAVLLLLLPSRTLAQAPQALVVIAADQHSAYERTAQVVAAIDRLAATYPGVPLAILIDGDTLESGNAVARRSSGVVDFAMFRALAKRAPTVVNLGNHEMEFNDLARTVARIPATGAQSSAISRIEPPIAPPRRYRSRFGWRHEAVVAGVATDNLSTYPAAVRASLDVPEPVAWAHNLADLLGAAPVAIVLSHAGLKADRSMLPRCRTERCSRARTIIFGWSSSWDEPSTSTPVRGTRSSPSPGCIVTETAPHAGRSNRCRSPAAIRPMRSWPR